MQCQRKWGGNTKKSDYLCRRGPNTRRPATSHHFVPSVSRAARCLKYHARVTEKAHCSSHLRAEKPMARFAATGAAGRWLCTRACGEHTIFSTPQLEGGCAPVVARQCCSCSETQDTRRWLACWQWRALGPRLKNECPEGQQGGVCSQGKLNKRQQWWRRGREQSNRG